MSSKREEHVDEESSTWITPVAKKNVQISISNISNENISTLREYINDETNNVDKITLTHGHFGKKDDVSWGGVALIIPPNNYVRRFKLELSFLQVNFEAIISPTLNYKSLSIKMPYWHDYIKCLSEALKRMKYIERLSVRGLSSTNEFFSLTFSDFVSSAFSSCASLKKLHLIECPLRQSELNSILNNIAVNTTLTDLKIHALDLGQQLDLSRFRPVLEANNTLTHLEIFLRGHVIRDQFDFIHALRTNSSLISVNVSIPLAGIVRFEDAGIGKMLLENKTLKAFWLHCASAIINDPFLPEAFLKNTSLETFYIHANTLSDGLYTNMIRALIRNTTLRNMMITETACIGASYDVLSLLLTENHTLEKVKLTLSDFHRRKEFEQIMKANTNLTAGWFYAKHDYDGGHVADVFQLREGYISRNKSYFSTLLRHVYLDLIESMTRPCTLSIVHKPIPAFQEHDFHKKVLRLDTLNL